MRRVLGWLFLLIGLPGALACFGGAIWLMHLMSACRGSACIGTGAMLISLAASVLGLLLLLLAAAGCQMRRRDGVSDAPRRAHGDEIT